MEGAAGAINTLFLTFVSRGCCWSYHLADGSGVWLLFITLSLQLLGGRRQLDSIPELSRVGGCMHLHNQVARSIITNTL